MERQLATIRKIDNIYPIKGADRIELVQIGGWTCIAKKHEFTIGDLCVYFEIDSFLPEYEVYSFLGKPSLHQGKLGHRVKSMKMKGALSQGLALPLSMFPLILSPKNNLDVSEMLNITKYDIDLQSSTGNGAVTQKTAGNFPSFIPKTDQPRIQNLQHYFELHKDTMFEETLKLDGSSCTMYKTTKNLSKWEKFKSLFVKISTDKFGVCSRNLELKRPSYNETPSNFWAVAKKYKIEDTLPKGYAIQGEVLAPNIQGNYEKVLSVEYYIFNVFDITKQEYLPPSDARAFVLKHLPNAYYIPVISTDVNVLKNATFDSLQERVNSQSINKGVKSEGRVYKSQDGKVTFKVINNEYLLKTGK